MASDNSTLCPSAQSDWEDSQVIGVIVGTTDKPEMAYLGRPQPVTKALLDSTHPVSPEEVYRFSAPCRNSGCGHFDAEGAKCRLAEKTVRWVPVVVEQLPVCSIRGECRWWQQEGRAACFRCPQVVTKNFNPTKELRRAADPYVD